MTQHIYIINNQYVTAQQSSPDCDWIAYRTEQIYVSARGKSEVEALTALRAVMGVAEPIVVDHAPVGWEAH